MPDEDKTFSGSLVLDLRIWSRHLHTLYMQIRAKLFVLNNTLVPEDFLFFFFFINIFNYK